MTSKRLSTIGNKFYHETEFEYRGHTYTVEYSSGYTTFAQKPAYLQHKENQERIDRLIENPSKEVIEEATFDIDKVMNLYY